MPDLCGVLFGLLVALVIVAVVGHCLWLLAAAVFHSLQGDGPAPRLSGRDCPHCGSRAVSTRGRCLDCGRGVTSSEPVTHAQEVWNATTQQLSDLHNRGLLSDDQYRGITTILKSERKRVALERVAKSASPVEATAPSEELLDIVDFEDVVPPESLEDARVSAPEEIVEPVAPVPNVPAEPHPKRDWGGFLQAFMEEKNIRWGELVSGLLIVGSAIGLVISLWTTLQSAIPYFAALLFMLVTASIHGAGLYTLKRWKLKSTSRGLLLISTLLIPLNFLAAIALSGRPGSPNYVEATSPDYLLAVSIGVLCYGAIAFSSGRVFRRRHWWVLWCAVMIPSVGQLVIARQAEPGMSTSLINLLASLPLAGFALAAAAQLAIATAGRRFTLRRSEQTFQSLGIGAFSFLMAAGLLVAKSGDWFSSLAELAPSVSIFAVLVSAAGLVVQHRATRPGLAGYRTAGTAIALTGSTLMLISLGLAWPRPELLVAVGVVDVVALTALALAARLPVLHLPAIGALGLVALTALHWGQGEIHSGPDASGRDLIDALLMGRSGLVLLGLGSVCFVGSFLWSRNERGEDARAYQWGAAGLGSVSLLVAFVAGFFTGDERPLATPVFAVAAIVSLAVCRILRQAWAAWCATGLLLVTFIHAVDWNEPIIAFLGELGLLPRDPMILSALLAATIAGGSGILFAVRLRNRDESERLEVSKRVVSPLCIAALVASAHALTGALVPLRMEFGIHAGYLFWIAALWGVVAATLRMRVLAAAAQGISFVAVGFAGVVVAQNAGWWDDNFADPRFWQIEVGLLAGWCLLWSVTRRMTPDTSVAARLLGRRRFNVDHVVLAGTAIGAVILSVNGVLPGITNELALAPTGSVDGTIFKPLPADICALVVMIALFGAGVFAVSAACSTRLCVPLSIGGLFAVGILAMQLTDVTAETYHFAIRFSAAHASGIGGWIVVAVVLAAFAASLRERISTPAICGLVAVGGLVPVLFASGTEGRLPTATTLRFGFAVYAVLLAAAFSFRRQIGQAAAKLGCDTTDANVANIVEGGKATGFAITLWPIFAMTLFAVVRAAAGDAAAVSANGIFGRFEFGLSYAAPIWLFAGAMLASAVLQRDNRFAISASLLIQFGVAVLLVLPWWQTVGNLTGAGLVELLQWSGIGLGVCTLLWIAGRRRIESPFYGPQPAGLAQLESLPFAIQIRWTVANAFFLSFWAAAAIVASLTEFGFVIEQLGNPLGFVAFGLATAAVMVCPREPGPGRLGSISNYRLPAALVLFVPLLAAAAMPLGARLEINDPWLAYHVLIVGWGVMMAAMTALSVAGQKQISAETEAEQPSVLGRLMSSMNADGLRVFALALGGVLVCLGIRAQWDDPHRPWWLVGTAAAVATANAALGIAYRRQISAYVSTALVLLATVAAMSKPWIGLAPAPTMTTYCTVFEAMLIALAAAGLAWLGVELFWQRRRGEEFDSVFSVPPVHHTVAGIGVLSTTLFAGWLLFTRELVPEPFAGGLPTLMSPLGAFVLGSGFLLLVASLWDRRARHALPALFVLGLVCCVSVLDGTNAGVWFADLRIEIEHLWFGMGVIAAGYVAFTAGIWGARKPMIAVARRLSVAEETTSVERTATWLPWANLYLAGFAVIVGFWSVLRFEEPGLQFAAGAATVLLVPGLALFAQGDRGESFRLLSLTTAVAAGVQLAWALPFDVTGTRALWLQHTIRLLEILSVATLIYAAGLWKIINPASSWGRSLRQAAIGSGGAALASLALVLVMEGTLFEPKHVPITNVQIAVVSVILVGLAGGLILLAVVPGRDPLKLSERGRTGYVYAAEVVGALLFLHIYLTKPRLFRGLLQPYWPFIVIGIAFVGVGLSEWFRRKKLRVLAEPLERSGTFLPLLPVLAFWVLSSDEQFNKYSLVLLLAGLVYVLLASLRKSFVYSVAAGILANGSLWSMYHHAGVALLARPQVWLIPPALSMLVAAQLNRKRLSEAQLAAVRYCSILMIYISSTGEMFIKGVGENFWHPVILATLSVLGVLAGMLMRVRAFLYLGTSFLFLSLVSMVWHAAEVIDDIWPWWVFGIVLGLMMLALFGLFEKKRRAVLGVLNQLKEWER